MPLAEHPRLLAGLQRWLPQAVPFQGHIFRFINPIFSSSTDILNGTGGLHADGRWNVKGQFRCSYTSQTPDTALQEVLAAIRRKGLPDEVARSPKTVVFEKLVLPGKLNNPYGSINASGFRLP